MVARAEDPAEMLRMVRVLADIGYRDLAKDANAQRLSVSRRLSREGIDARVLQLLWEYAKACDTQGSPDKLFSWWMNTPSRVLAKVQEMRTKNVWLRQTLDKVTADEKAREQEGRIVEFPRKAEGQA